MLPALLVFLLAAGAVVGIYVAATRVPAAIAQRKLEQRLQSLSGGAAGEEDEGAGLVVRPDEGPLPGVERQMARTSAGSWLTRHIEQSGCKTTPSAVVLMTLGCALLAAIVARVLTSLWFAWPLAAIAASGAPFAFLLRRRSVRIRLFEEQFPEALDLLSRAIRAGHAFQASMGMVADDMKAPVGPEFKRSFDQQNFGLPLRDALNQLAERVPLLDVRFFATAVMIQRETGGNLSEILDNLAHVVRERFKILRQVRVYTAHGRFSAFVLLALPAAAAIALSLINPDHMQPLFTERMGQTLIVGALIMQTIGFFWIRHIIRIEV
jgi:tight adherence protein B